MKITAKYLDLIGACPVEVRDFKRLFPRGMTVTLKNILKCDDESLTVEWFAENGMNARAFRMFWRRMRPHKRAYHDRAIGAIAHDVEVCKALFHTLKHYGADALYKRQRR